MSMWQATLILLAIVFLILFIYISLSVKRPIMKRKPDININGYNLFYSDQKIEEKQEDVIYSKILVSEIHGIQGKPDYIFRHKSGLKMIPVELKSGTIGDADSPREGDLMQLVMYFLIIEDVYGIKPKEGRLLYSDYMFIIQNTRTLRRKLKYILKDMRDMLKTGEQNVLPSFSKCKHCMCRGTVCEYCEVR